ncbi:MAG: hypothetical protein P8J87_07225 [Verrucomicrobiales bacterium]|nr:hypothetical protein [Verrucomicrobiales bacterium]
MKIKPYTLVFTAALLATAGATGEFRTFLSTDGNTIRAKVIKVSDNKVQVIREDGKNFIFPIDRLSDTDQEYLEAWKPDTTKLGDDPASKYHPSLYPRSKKEIKAGIKAIFDRDTANTSFSKEENEALAVMNTYRFLSGIPSDVKLDKNHNAIAREAAEGCASIGRLSHGVNSAAGKCNLHQGQSSLAGSVHSYMDDHGDNNRARRGHRKWNLTARIGKMGIAAADGGRFMGQYVFDKSGKKNFSPKGGFHAYPGPGLYPIEYFKSNGWSLYPQGKIPSKSDLKIRCFKLTKRPAKPLATYAVPDHSREIDISYIATEGSIVFEPDTKPESGHIYYITARGGGLSIAYLVEFIKI